jgi:EmrB/QacA subfamily drug resistance transporter
MTMDHNTNKRSTLLVTTLGSFLIPFMGSSINIALPSIGKEFAMNAVLLIWVTTSYLLTVGIFLVPFGRIADIYGREKIFFYGFVIYTLSSFLSAMATSPFFLIASRILQGIGASMTFSTGVAILMSVFPAGERGKVLGINVAAVYLGLSCGPFLGGLLTHYFGWRTIFLINVPFGLLIIFFTFWKLKGEWTEARGEKFDFFGSILYSFILVTIVYGFSLLPGIWGVFFILLGVLGIWAFVKWEIKSESPVFDIDLFRNNKVFAFSNLAALINYSAIFAVSFLLSLYLQLIKGLSPQAAGMIMISQPIVQAVFSPFAGRLSDRIEPRMVASTGMALTTVGLAFFIFLDEKTTISFIVVGLILIGFGLALFSSPNTNAVMSSIERKFYGVASGILGTMRTTGNMFSMGIVMLIFSLYIGRTQITPSYYPLFIKSVKSAFIIFTSLCLAGIFASLPRGRVR